MVQEIVRRGVANMIARQEMDMPPEDVDAHLDQIGSDTARIQKAQHARDWKVAAGFAGEIASESG